MTDVKLLKGAGVAAAGAAAWWFWWTGSAQAVGWRIDYVATGIEARRATRRYDREARR